MKDRGVRCPQINSKESTQPLKLESWTQIYMGRGSGWGKEAQIHKQLNVSLDMIAHRTDLKSQMAS
eukprot:3718115-Pleurochrysis_carterae.AAC.1